MFQTHNGNGKIFHKKFCIIGGSRQIFTTNHACIKKRKKALFWKKKHIECPVHYQKKYQNIEYVSSWKIENKISASINKAFTGLQWLKIFSKSHNKINE